jgi:hypothetical protein
MKYQVLICELATGIERWRDMGEIEWGPSSDNGEVIFIDGPIKKNQENDNDKEQEETILENSER